MQTAVKGNTEVVQSLGNTCWPWLVRPPQKMFYSMFTEKSAEPQECFEKH